MASEAEGGSSSAAAVAPEAGEAQQQQQQQAAQEAAAVVVAEGDEARQEEEEEVRGCLGCKHRIPIAAAAAGLILHCASYPICSFKQETADISLEVELPTGA